MKLNKNDVFEIDGFSFLVVETMETESNEEYAMLLNLKNWADTIVCKVENEEDGVSIQKVANDYLQNKLKSAFCEKMKTNLLEKYKIKIVD